MTNSSPKASPDMANAAEALIKAAYSHAESSNTALVQDTVAGLKKLSLESSSIQQSIADLKSSSDSKMDELIDTLIDEIVELKDRLNQGLKQQSRRQSLEWAIANFVVKGRPPESLGSFDYYPHSVIAQVAEYRELMLDFSSPISASNELVRKLLLKFRQGLSTDISGYGVLNQKSKEDGEQGFVFPNPPCNRFRASFRAQGKWGMAHSLLVGRARSFPQRPHPTSILSRRE